MVVGELGPLSHRSDDLSLYGIRCQLDEAVGGQIEVHRWCIMNRRDDIGLINAGFGPGMSDLDLSIAHRMLFLPWTQRICHPSRPHKTDEPRIKRISTSSLCFKFIIQGA